MEDIYIAEFIVHEGVCRLPKIENPSVVIRFLQFPALSIASSGKLVFGKGKSCKFSMQREFLLKSLQSTPLYVMLVDKYSKLIGTSALDLSVFAHSEIPTRSSFKRNSIDLYDPVKNIVGRLDMSISIHQQSSDLSGSHAKEIFKNIVHEPISKLQKGEDKAVGTDPIVKGNSAGAEKSTSTDTLPVPKPEPSMFDGSYQPPPMFLCNPQKKKTVQKRVEQQPPQVQREIYFEAPRKQYEDSSEQLLIDKLLQELMLLKGGKPQNPEHFEFKKPKPTMTLQTNTVNTFGITPTKPHIATQRLSEYSDDFEEESLGYSSSLDKFVKCFVCGEMIRARDAGQHKNCKRNKKLPMLSPRDEFEISQSYRDNKSIATSIIEEYDSDFEEESIS